MRNSECDVGARNSAATSRPRRITMLFLGLGLLVPLIGCDRGESEMKHGAVLNVEMYSYLNRPIYDIVFNSTDLGVMDAYGATGTITSVRIPFGIQKLHWRLDGPKGTPRNGELVSVRNEALITHERIPSKTRYIGLHLYPDDTVEVTFSEFIPDRTARGEKIISESD